jgi:hypothetical protein
MLTGALVVLPKKRIAPTPTVSTSSAVPRDNALLALRLHTLVAPPQIAHVYIGTRIRHYGADSMGSSSPRIAQTCFLDHHAEVNVDKAPSHPGLADQ